MRIGYFVQGSADEAFVWGLVHRYCPEASMEEGKFRGKSGESLKRELPKALRDLHDNKRCDYLIVLNDADKRQWRDVWIEEWPRVPDSLQHLTVFGVAKRNIEHWIALDRVYLAKELGCDESAIPRDDPTGFIKHHFKRKAQLLDGEEAQKRLRDFVAEAPIHTWLRNSPSFDHFWDDLYQLSKRADCANPIPNERNLHP